MGRWKLMTSVVHWDVEASSREEAEHLFRRAAARVTRLKQKSTYHPMKTPEQVREMYSYIAKLLRGPLVIREVLPGERICSEA